MALTQSVSKNKAVIWLSQKAEFDLVIFASNIIQSFQRRGTKTKTNPNVAPKQNDPNIAKLQRQSTHPTPSHQGHLANGHLPTVVVAPLRMAARI